VTLRTPHRSRINGIVTSCVVHGVVIAAAVFLTTASESTRSHPSPAAYEPPSHIIWLSAPGLGGGGGGGGAKEQSPARAAEVKGPDKQTMPSASRAMSDTPEQPKPVDPLPDVPVQTLGASNLTSMGLIEAGAETLSLGAQEPVAALEWDRVPAPVSDRAAVAASATACGRRVTA
jgi:hypothetical protein